MEGTENFKPKHPYELFGVECGSGWYQLLEPIYNYIEKYNSDIPEEEKIQILQVKEKYGTLNVYVSHGTRELFDLIDFAESESENVCEDCGTRHNVGTTMVGWIRTICLDCAKKEAVGRGYPIVLQMNDTKQIFEISENE